MSRKSKLTTISVLMAVIAIMNPGAVVATEATELEELRQNVSALWAEVTALREEVSNHHHGGHLEADHDRIVMDVGVMQHEQHIHHQHTEEEAKLVHPYHQLHHSHDALAHINTDHDHGSGQSPSQDEHDEHFFHKSEDESLHGHSHDHGDHEILGHVHVVKVNFLDHDHSHDHDGHVHGTHSHGVGDSHVHHHGDHDHDHNNDLEHEHTHEHDHDDHHEHKHTHEHDHDDHHEHKHTHEHDHDHDDDHEHKHTHEHDHDDHEHEHEQTHEREDGSDHGHDHHHHHEHEEAHGHDHHHHHEQHEEAHGHEIQNQYNHDDHHIADIAASDPLHPRNQDDVAKASCDLRPNSADPSSGVTGNITISQKRGGEGPVFFDLTISGFQTNGVLETRFGFHIHERAVDKSGDCGSAGGHFNPHGVVHGGPTDEIRHTGDLGNIVVPADGLLDGYVIVDHKVAFSGEDNIIGKSIVVHAGVDDLGTGGDAGSLATGNAGGRLACCNIYLAPAPRFRFGG